MGSDKKTENTEIKEEKKRRREGRPKKTMAERLKTAAPVLSIVLVGALVGVSITGYIAPEYEIDQILVEVDAEAAEADAPVGDFDLADGVYDGTGNGFGGYIDVEVTIESRTITQIDVTSAESEDEVYFNLAKTVIDNIISEQSYEIDTISGATYSSRGILNAVRNAITGEVDTNAFGNGSSGEGETEVEEVEDAEGYVDGTYYGTATGFSGDITVMVVIENGEIASITVVSYVDDEAYFSKAITLIDKIISGQTTNVDAVSGATYSSVGIINAVRKALAQAATDGSSEEEEEEAVTTIASTLSTSSRKTVSAGSSGNFPYPDGTYYGTGEGWGGDITLAVTIKDQSITKVTVVSAEDETEEYFSAASVILDDVVTAQSIDIDAVSGATYSSNGILEALQNAIASAKAAASAGSASTSSSSSSSGSSSSGSAASSSSETVSAGTAASEDDEVLYNDGEYTVYVTCEPDEDEDFEAYTLCITVTIEDGIITSVDAYDYEDGEDSDNSNYIGWALDGRSSCTGIAAQAMALSYDELSADAVAGFDTVTRATCSSNALIEGLQQVLALADASGDSSLSDSDSGDSTGNSSDTSGDSGSTDSSSDDDSYSGSGSSGDDDSNAESGDDSSDSSDSGSGSGSSDSSDTGSSDDADDSSDSGSDSDEDGDDCSDTDSSSSSNLADGEYVIEVTCEPDEDEDFDAYTLCVTVTIEDGVVTAVEAYDKTADDAGEDSDNEAYINRALNGRTKSGVYYYGIAEQAASLTSAELEDEDNIDGMDTVSGATCSSNALIEALKEAVTEAIDAKAENAAADASADADGTSDEDDASDDYDTVSSAGISDAKSEDAYTEE